MARMPRMPQICMAFAEASADTLAKMKKGNEANFIIYEAPGLGLPMKLSLEGFSNALAAILIVVAAVVVGIAFRLGAANLRRILAESLPILALTGMVTILVGVALFFILELEKRVQRQYGDLIEQSLAKAHVDRCMDELASTQRQAVALAYYRGGMHDCVSLSMTAPPRED